MELTIVYRAQLWLLVAEASTAMLMLAATQHNGKLNVAGLHYYILMSVTMVVLGKPNIFCFMYSI